MKTFLLLALTLALVARTTASEGQPLQIDPQQSRIEVAVHATMDSFTAHLSNFEPDIVYDPARGTVERATLAFRFADLQTGKAGRDREMQHWEDSEHFPTGRFELTNLEALPPGRHLAHGVLQLHGVSRELSFPVVLAGNHSRLSIDGEARLDVRDFGLKAIRKFGVLKVNPEVTVRFHLQGDLVRPVALQDPAR